MEPRLGWAKQSVHARTVGALRFAHSTLLRILCQQGKYGDKFTTKVDISWNELSTGVDQERFFRVEGDRLTIRTAEQVSAV